MVTLGQGIGQPMGLAHEWLPSGYEQGLDWARQPLHCSGPQVGAEWSQVA